MIRFGTQCNAASNCGWQPRIYGAVPDKNGLIEPLQAGGMSMTSRVTKGRAPEYFITSTRKVEPLGGDCIRIYCSMERNGVWEDQMTIIMPIAAAMESSMFVMESASGIFEEGRQLRKAAN